MIKDILKDAGSRMRSAITSLEEDLGGIRTGRANPGLIEKLPIEYYGAETPLLQLATISVPEARVLMIRPFDPSTLKAIEKAILASELGLTPTMTAKSFVSTCPHSLKNAAATWSRSSTAAWKRAV